VSRARLAFALGLALIAGCDETRRIPGATGGGGGGGTRADAGTRADGAIDDATDEPADGGAAHDGGASETPGDGGARDAGASDPPRPDAGSGGTISGTVYLFQQQLLGQRSANLAAAFIRGVFDASACTTRAEGPCQITMCTPSGAPTIEPLDGGEVRARAGAQSFVTRFDAAQRAYVPASGTWVVAGTSVSFEVAGRGAIPALSATLTTPAELTLRQPEITTPNERLPIAPNSALDLAWGGEGPGQVSVSLSAGTEGGPSVSTQCLFSLAARRGQIPASVLGALAGVADEASMYVGSTASTRTQQGGVDVTFSLLTAGRSATGALTVATLVLR
jgi:hypothetical protein